MMDDLDIPRRTLQAQRRLALQMAPLMLQMRRPRPGALGRATLLACNEAMLLARRAFAREPQMPSFTLLPEDTVLTQADFALVVNQLVSVMSLVDERNGFRAGGV